MTPKEMTNSGLKKNDWLDRYLADPEIEPKAFIRKRLIWIWSIVSALCISGMTLLAVFRGMKPVAVYGLLLLAYYGIFLPLLKYIRRFELANFIFLLITVLTTFGIILYVGGLAYAFGLYLVGLTCAMASMLSNNRQWTVALFSIYGLTIILAALLQPWLSVPPQINDADRLLFYTLNILWISASMLQFTLDYISARGKQEEAEVRRIKELDEIKTKVYTNITHEFRTPLTIILGMANQIEKNPEQWLDRGLKKIRAHSKILLHLINQMLDLSKLEAGAMPLKLIQGDVIAYLRYLADSYFIYAESREIDFQFSARPEKLVMDYDPEKLTSIISNLVSNAMKYTPPGGKVHLMVDGETEHGERLIIQVKDNGIGIPAEKMKQVFERFYRIDNKEGPQPGGAGLGLALTRELIRILKGEIAVESSPGQGSLFTVRLPASRQQSLKRSVPLDTRPESLELYFQDSPQKKSAGREVTPLIDEKPILLIVEDNPDVVEYLIALLESDFQLVTAENGRQGLKKAIQLIPDIILSDVMMPEMDGFTFLEKVKEDWRTSHVPVILLTAKADIDSRLKGLKHGADAYLAKPFHEDELRIRLRQLIALRRKLRQRYGKSTDLTIPDPHLKKEDEFILKLQKKLDERLDDTDFGVDALALALNISRAQLYRKLLALTGQSVNRYILSYRLQRAYHLFETTDLNVTEVAFEVGFKNLSHFSRAFHEKFDLPPSAVRKT